MRRFNRPPYPENLIRLSLKTFSKVPLVEVKRYDYDLLFKVKLLGTNETNLQGQLKVSANAEHMGYIDTGLSRKMSYSCTNTPNRRKIEVFNCFRTNNFRFISVF